MPLPSNVWLWIHVPLLVAAYALLSAGAAAGGLFLVQDSALKRRQFLPDALRLPSLQSMDRFAHLMVLAAFPILSLGMLAGSLWAHETRGHYWGWTPKETFALITWLIYAAYFGMRSLSGWRGRKATYLSLAGYALALLTWILVNTLSVFRTY